MKTSDYYLLLLHVGMKDTKSKNLSKMRTDDRALGTQIKNTEPKLSFLLSCQLEEEWQQDINK